MKQMYCEHSTTQSPTLSGLIDPTRISRIRGLMKMQRPMSENPKYARNEFYCSSCRRTMEFVRLAGFWRCDKDKTTKRDGCGKRLEVK